MDFYNLDLSDNTLDAIDDMRWTTCTPIQEECIPEILEGKDRNSPNRNWQNCGIPSSYIEPS